MSYPINTVFWLFFFWNTSKTNCTRKFIDRNARSKFYFCEICDVQSFAITVKPGCAVTSTKQSPVLKGHLFSCLVIENFIWIEPPLRGHLSYKASLLCPKGDLLIQVWLYIHFWSYVSLMLGCLYLTLPSDKNSTSV